MEFTFTGPWPNEHAQDAAERARHCACGAIGAIYLWNWNAAWDHTGWKRIPACGPCAVALMEQGWTPEKEDLSCGS